MRKLRLWELATLGMAAGMRPTVPLAALSLILPRRRILAVPASLGAVGELIYDKWPQALDRTSPPLLLGRVVAGGLVGGLATRALGGSTAVGAAIGALVALASTFASHRLRALAAAHVPGATAAVGEDLFAVGLTAAALRPLR